LSIRDLGVMVAAKASPKAGHVPHPHHASYRTLLLGFGLGLGALIVILAIPLLLRKVRPNRVYGLVSVLALESKTKWYAANRYLGAGLLVAGLITLAGTAVIWLGRMVRSSNKLLALVELVLVVAPALIAYLSAAARYRSR